MRQRQEIQALLHGQRRGGRPRDGRCRREAAASAHSHFCHDCSDQLDDAASAVFALIEAGKFDDAEQAAHDVLACFPSVHDGYECLGRLHQAKGDHRQAADCYRKVIEFARKDPHLYDPDFVDYFQELIEQLEPQAAAG